jgi:hypothetical protein
MDIFFGVGYRLSILLHRRRTLLLKGLYLAVKLSSVSGGPVEGRRHMFRQAQHDSTGKGTLITRIKRYSQISSWKKS